LFENSSTGPIRFRGAHNIPSLQQGWHKVTKTTFEIFVYLCPGVWLLLLLSQLLQLPIHAEWCPLLNANTTAANLNNNNTNSNSYSSVNCGLDFTLSYTVIIILTLILHLGERKLTFIFSTLSRFVYTMLKKRGYLRCQITRKYGLSQSCEQKGVIFSRGFELDYDTVILRTIKNLFR
jgi:hypothetical protein